MKFTVKDRSMNDYGKVFDGEVIARYINGYKVRYNGQVTFVDNRIIKVLDISEEEAGLQISW